MLVLLLSAALIQADSVYASPALREIVARAAEGNRVPAELHSYQALVESEAALVIHSARGEEVTGQIEQIASRVQWHRDGVYRQRILGHRTRAAGPNLSVLSYMRRGWLAPVLYGEWLRLLLPRPDSAGQGEHPPDSVEEGEQQEPAYEALHPFSKGRERVYRFEGGDTVAVLHLPERTVRVVRVRVIPHRPPDRRALAFDGIIDLDADRHQIVRMRGRMVVFRPDRGLGTRLLGLWTRALAYVEFENAEHEGRYWLPYRQRVEFQATSPMTESRAVMRIVSRFRDYRFNVTDPPVAQDQARGSSRLTFAPRDTLAHYDWSCDPGERTAGLNARDFDDVAPEGLRTEGPPHLRFGVRRFTDLLHYNRVEGLYTGAGAVLAFRDAAPGLELRGLGGWAWQQEVPRGAVEASLRRKAWRFAVRAGRELEHTNDFLAPLEQSGGISLLLGAGDDFDYVDRRAVTVDIARTFDSAADSRVRIQAGWAHDRAEPRRVRRGPLGGDTLRLNRPTTPGHYVLSRLVIEHGRSVNANSMQPGLGVDVTLERADGELDWRRIETGVQLRATRGRFTYVTRLDAGVVLGDPPPPQTLYELGGPNGLPGYGYKEFAGNRAALVRGMIMYDLGIFDAPIRLGALILPAVSPAPAVQWQAGWTAATHTAEPALRTLGSRETDGIRSTLDLRLTFFSGMFSVGFARPLDRHAGWDLIWSIGGAL